jgi:hypothetical protein
MSKLHCTTLVVLWSGCTLNSATGATPAAPANGSLSVRIGLPGRNIRVCAVKLWLFRVIGIRWAGSVTELNCWLPDKGGIFESKL